MGVGAFCCLCLCFACFLHLDLTAEARLAFRFFLVGFANELRERERESARDSVGDGWWRWTGTVTLQVGALFIISPPLSIQFITIVLKIQFIAFS